MEDFSQPDLDPGHTLDSIRSNGSWQDAASRYQDSKERETSTNNTDSVLNEYSERNEGEKEQNGTGDQINATNHSNNLSRLITSTPHVFNEEARTEPVLERSEMPEDFESHISETSDIDYVFDDAILSESSDDEEDLGGFCGYSFIENCSAEDMHQFNPDYVDGWLGSMYRDEVYQVMLNIKSKLPNPSKPTPSDFVDLTMPESLLMVIVDFCNKRLDQQKRQRTDVDELRLCIIAYLRCALYNASFEDTFSKQESRWYGLGGTLNIKRNRCMEVMQALSGPSSARTGLSWEIVSTEAKSYLGRLEEYICSINTPLFLTSNTIISLDDDHIRQRSRKVNEITSLKVVNNPKKAIGPVQTACCSALTGFYICGHYSTVGENLKATFEKLFMSIQGLRHPEDITTRPGLIIACDRGYITKDTIDFILHRLGADVIGTHKRTLGFPFTYGSGAVSIRHKGIKIPEQGARAVFYAKKVVRPGVSISSSRRVSLTAIAYREAVNGRIAFLVTSLRSLGGGWSSISAMSRILFTRHVSYSESFSTNTAVGTLHTESLVGFKRVPFENVSAENTNCEVPLEFTTLLSELTCFTEAQSECRAWFIQRAFKFTSRTSCGYLRSLRSLSERHCFPLSPHHELLIFSVYGESYSRRCEDERAGISNEERRLLLEQLRDNDSNMGTYRVHQLNSFLKQLGLPVVGRKHEKISRLLAEVHRENEEDPSNTARVEISVDDFNYQLKKEYLGVALDSWLMKPALKDNENLRIGRLNENIVLRNLQFFLLKNDSPFKMGCLVSSGLVSRYFNNSQLCTIAGSPDGICFIRDSSGERVENVLCAVEVKTLTKTKTQSPAREYARNFGFISHVTVGTGVMSEQFRKGTLNVDYRIQCLHHAASLGVTRCE